MAKIAVELEQALERRQTTGGTGQISARVLAQGDGWCVRDMICTSGPADRPFEECNSNFAIAIVAAGSFQYRSSNHHSTRCGELMTPGSLLLGNAGHCFECGHEHGLGDRCLSFQYSRDYFEQLAADAGAIGRGPTFRTLRLPPLRALAPLIARACAGLTGSIDTPWEELSVELGARTLQLANDRSANGNYLPPATAARMTRTIRMIENELGSGGDLGLGKLARVAGLSPYHFLRTFQQVTGVTPHQYLLRMRLREAAMRLAAKEPVRILDIALDSGFGDVSNFNRAFRAEFGVNPRAFRRQHSAFSPFA